MAGNDVAVMADRLGRCRRVAFPAGTHLAEFATPAPVTGGVATDSTGSLFAIGCADGITRLWRAGTAQLDDLPGRDEKVSSVAVNSDGSLVGWGYADGVVRLYDSITRLHRTIDTNVDLDVGFHRSVRAIAFDGKDGCLVTAGHSGAVRVWETSTCQLLATLKEPGQAVGAMAVSPSGKLIAIGDVEGRLEFLNRHSGETRMLAGHVDSVLALAFGTDDRILVSGGRDRLVKIWDTAAGTGSIEMTDLNGWVRTVVFSADGSGITAIDGGGTIAAWGIDGLLRSLSRSAPDSLVDIAGCIDASRSWLHEASLHNWDRINCGCGRGAAHVPSDFARLIAAETPAEASGRGLIDDVEIQNMLFQAIVPLMPMAILAISEEPLSGPARRTLLELILAGVSGDTDYVEQRLGRDNLEDLCRKAIRPHVPFLRSLMSSGVSSQEQELLHEILIELD
jgi:hypothetical protein